MLALPSKRLPLECDGGGLPSGSHHFDVIDNLVLTGNVLASARSNLRQDSVCIGADSGPAALRPGFLEEDLQAGARIVLI
jgi:hypothetical protein